MQLVVVGLNHIRSSTAVRERAMFLPHEFDLALERLRTVFDEGFLLSTCNRTEAYALTGHAQSGAEKLRHFISVERAIPEEVLAENSYQYAHDDAVRHCFRVASGLDSMALGETEILGQIRRALDHSRSAGALGPLLGRLGAAALRAGRDVRSATQLGRNRVSLVSLAYKEALDRGFGFNGARVAIFGAGETAESVIRHVQSNSTADIVITGRTEERVNRIAALYGIVPQAWGERSQVIASSDIVFACTSAPEPVLLAEHVATRTKPLVCLDLGAPRDVDPAVGDTAGVTVIDLFNLEAVAAENRSRRSSEVVEAEAVVDRSVAKFMEWWRSRQVVPTITDMRSLAENIRDDEIERALARMGPLDPNQVQNLRAMAHRIVGKLLHRPLTMLRHDAENANMAMVLRYLYQLDGSPMPGSGPAGIPCAHAGITTSEAELLTFELDLP